MGFKNNSLVGTGDHYSSHDLAWMFPDGNPPRVGSSRSYVTASQSGAQQFSAPDSGSESVSKLLNRQSNGINVLILYISSYPI